MTTHCFSPMLGKRLRVTELDLCGAAEEGNRFISTDGFITVSLSSEIEDGTEILQRKANGQLCVNEKQSDSFKRFTVEVEFCGVNPSLLALVSNAEEYLDYAGDVAGFTVPEGEINKRFALELWMGLSGIACLPGQVDEASAYLLLPFVNGGVLGDVTIDGENAVNFTLTGASTRGGNQWGTGPFNVVRDETGVMSPLPTALDPYDHMLLIDTALAPPPDACSPMQVGDPLPWQAAPGDVFAAMTEITAEDPTNAAKLAGLGFIPNPGTAWTSGEYITIGTYNFYWTGTAWAEGDNSA